MSRIAIMHTGWFEHPEVGADEIAVLAVLALHADKDGSCFPSQGLLARLLNRSRPWVNKVIGTLVELGLITKTGRTRHDGGDRSCLYRLIAPTVTLTNGLESSVSHDGDRGSQATDTQSHDPDTVKTTSEQETKTHTADAREVLNIVQLPADIPPSNWQPTDADLVWGMERFPNADLHAATERFVNRCQAKGYRYRDLSAAWRSWLVDDSQGGRFGKGGGKPSTAQVKFDAWAAVAVRHTREVRHAA